MTAGSTRGSVTWRRAVVGGHHLVPGADGSQGALETEHEERQGDEGLRQHDRRRREGDLDPEHLERAAEEPSPTEGVEQGDAADDGREDEGQQHEGPQQLLPAESRASQHDGHGHPEDDAEGGRGH
jgi:hypothetical protein